MTSTSTNCVHLVGCGPGGPQWVLPFARGVVGRSDIVFGPSDLQGLFPEATGPRMDLPPRPEVAAPLVLAALEKGLECAVLLRGDCGLHSLAKGLQSRLPVGTCRRVPGLSSVQVACAVFGLDWEGAHIVSAHGRSWELDAAARSARLLVVLGGGEDFAPLLEKTRRDLGRSRMHLACDLTLPTQALWSPAFSDPVPLHLATRTIALFERILP